MLKQIACLIFLLLFFSCRENKEFIYNGDGPVESGDSTNLHSAKSKLDTIFYPVYELSQRTIAITLNLNNKGSNTVFDSIFIALYNSNYNSINNSIDTRFYDTIGRFKLLRNLTLDKEIKKHLDKEYYIYGTKGVAKCDATNIIFSSSEGQGKCNTKILGFTLSNFNIGRYGHPIFCSNMFLNLNYTGDYSIVENQLMQTGKVPAKVFASANDYYFSYTDDFRWGRLRNDKDCPFPSRAILILDKNRVTKKYFSAGLDISKCPPIDNQ